MKINPTTKETFSNTGVFSKRLHCPSSVMWKDMTENGSNTRACSHCDKTIYDTEHLSDAEIEHLLAKDPQKSLKLSLNQDIVKIVH